MKPSQKERVIDGAGGTRYIEKLFLDYLNKYSEITCIDPKKAMIKKAK